MSCGQTPRGLLHSGPISLAAPPFVTFIGDRAIAVLALGVVENLMKVTIMTFGRLEIRRVLSWIGATARIGQSH